MRQEVQEGGFKFHDTAAMLVEDDGRPHTINFCKNCHYVRLAERNEPEVTHKKWKIMIGERNSRGKLSGCLGAKGVREQDVRTVRDQKVGGKDPAGERCDGSAIGQKRARRVAAQ